MRRSEDEEAESLLIDTIDSRHAYIEQAYTKAIEYD